MSEEAAAKYNPDLQPPTEDVSHCDELRLLSDEQKNSLKQYSELALLSKRKARALLNVGNITLNRLISEGEIKIILVNGKEKIPYISLQEFIYNMHSKKVIEYDTEEYFNEEESVAMAYKIIKEFKKGEK